MSSTAKARRPGFPRKILSKLLGIEALKAVDEAIAADSFYTPVQRSTLETTSPVNLSNARLAWDGFKLLAKTIEGALDETPAKGPVSGLNALIQIGETTVDNRTTLQDLLTELDNRSAKLARAYENAKSEEAKICIEDYSRILDKQSTKLEILRNKRLWKRVLQVKEDAQKIQTITSQLNASLQTMQIDTLLRIDRNASTIKNHLMYLHLNKASRAKYNAHVDMSIATRSRCTPGTRLDIITYIEEWANDYSVDCPSIFWLSGLAGTGKSTIAYTLCEMFESEEALESSTTLGASFFCSRQMEETRNTRYIIPTIVYQLSQVSASFNRFLHNSGWDSVDVLSFRMQERLVDPWVQSAHERSPDSAVLIVIDALEESDGGCDFLRMLLSHTHKLPGLKFLISSRPNPNIASQLTSREDVITFQLHTDIDSADVEQDIQSYLSAELPELAEDEVIPETAQQSGGLFIYAATAVKLAKPPRQQLSKCEQLRQLQRLRQAWPCDRGSQSLGLPVDDVYRQALHEAFANCPDDVRETRLKILHTILCARARLTCQCIAELLDIDVETVQVTVDSLFAVLFISPVDDAICWYHASFPDFIFNVKRSSSRTGPSKENDSNDTTWFCDASRLHYSLSLQCFHIMQTYG